MSTLWFLSLCHLHLHLLLLWPPSRIKRHLNVDNHKITLESNDVVRWLYRVTSFIEATKTLQLLVSVRFRITDLHSEKKSNRAIHPVCISKFYESSERVRCCRACILSIVLLCCYILSVWQVLENHHFHEVDAALKWAPFSFRLQELLNVYRFLIKYNGRVHW